MAKSARASTRKRNNAALRSKIFGPAIDARTARLSAKLQELVSKPKPGQQDATAMDLDHVNLITEGKERKRSNKDTDERVDDDEEDMDIDGQSSGIRSRQKAGKTRIGKTKTTKKTLVKKSGHRKARNVAVFPPVRRVRSGPGVFRGSKRRSTGL